MSDEWIATLVCLGLLVALCGFSAQRRWVNRQMHSYGHVYQASPKPKDNHLPQDG